MIKLFLTLLLVCFCFADLPVHCEYNQVEGSWVLSLTKNGQSSSVVDTCSLRSPISPASTKSVVLAYPNLATDETGAVGTWTMIYDQGMEIIVGGQKYFAFFMYTQNGSQVISDCSRTLTGWYHEENVVPPKSWGCFQAAKVSVDSHLFIHQEIAPSNSIFTNDKDMVKKINTKQSSWIAGDYSHFEGKDTSFFFAGNNNRQVFRRDAHKRHMQHFSKLMATPSNDFPKNLDWRNVSGQSYVNPVRNQGKCGSCYAFATMGVLESRARIATDDQYKPYFAPQTIVSCSKYSQGCDGGFPYLVAKYGQDFGLVEERCNPYNGTDMACKNYCPPDQKVYVQTYGYVGGFYGGSNMENMMYAVMNHGPIVVGIEVYRDLYYYKGGVYHHVADAETDTFEVLNHAVVIVGWGETADGEKYWIVRNSWGESWGVGGYFLIRRGTDECSIESLAVDATLLLK